MEAYNSYVERLSEIALSRFEWFGLPLAKDGLPGINERYLESILFEQGATLFFKDEEIGYLTLPFAVDGQLDVYNMPIKRRAYSNNGYSNTCSNEDSVICWNNYMRKPDYNIISMFAKRLANLDRTIDINCNAQKTPILIECDEKERLTFKNLYMQYDGNMPFIAGRRGLLADDSFKVLKTDAPYVAEQLYNLKERIWNEALTYLGVPNTNITKKERMITDEVVRGMGGTLASRNSALASRQNACKEIKEKLGLDVWVEYRISEPMEKGGVEDE